MDGRDARLRQHVRMKRKERRETEMHTVNGHEDVKEREEPSERSASAKGVSSVSG